MHLTRDDLAGYFGSRADPAWLDAFMFVGGLLFAHYQFDRLRWCHFAGQMGAETDGLSLMPMRENMTFTTSRRIMQVYSYRLGVALQRDPDIARQYSSREALARALVRQPKRLADIVYGGREGTPWLQGSRYIGRGPTQITHLDNYRAICVEIRKQPGGASCPDLVDQPEALEIPEWGVRAAFADWHLKRLDRWADRDLVDNVSAALNTGSPDKISITNGLDRRRRWVAKAKGRWPVDLLPVPIDSAQASADCALQLLREGDRGACVRLAQERLTALGYGLGRIDGVFGTMTTRAVRRLQDEHDLRVDGTIGPRTWDVLETTAPEELPSRATATASDAARAGVGSVQIGKALNTAGGLVTAAGAGEAASNWMFGSSLWGGVMTGLSKVGEVVGHLTAIGIPVSPKVSGMMVAIVVGVVMLTYGRKLIGAGLAAFKLGLK